MQLALSFQLPPACRTLQWHQTEIRISYPNSSIDSSIRRECSPLPPAPLCLTRGLHSPSAATHTGTAEAEGIKPAWILGDVGTQRQNCCVQERLEHWTFRRLFNFKFRTYSKLQALIFILPFNLLDKSFRRTNLTSSVGWPWQSHAWHTPFYLTLPSGRVEGLYLGIIDMKNTGWTCYKRIWLHEVRPRSCNKLKCFTQW